MIICILFKFSAVRQLAKKTANDVVRILAALHNNFRALCSMCKFFTFLAPCFWNSGLVTANFCFLALAGEPDKGLIFNSLTPFPRFVFAAAYVISVHNLMNFHEVRGVLRKKSLPI